MGQFKCMSLPDQIHFSFHFLDRKGRGEGEQRRNVGGTRVLRHSIEDWQGEGLVHNCLRGQHLAGQIKKPWASLPTQYISHVGCCFCFELRKSISLQQWETAGIEHKQLTTAGNIIMDEIDHHLVQPGSSFDIVDVMQLLDHFNFYTLRAIKREIRRGQKHC